MRATHVLSVFALLCASSTTVAPPVMAQAPAPTPAASEAPNGQLSDTPDPIGRMVVTATGAATPRATHAGNVSVIGGEDVVFVRPEHASEILNRAPAVNIQRGNGQEMLTAIRSPVLTGGAGAGSFLYLEDGVPLRAAGFGNVNGLTEAVYETAGDIELVRGPASALYGSNAVNGLINVLSRAPSPDFESEADVWFGPHGLINVRGTTSATYDRNGVSHGARASIAIAEDDGFRDDSGLGQQKGQLRYDYSSGRNRVRATVSGFNLNQETAGFIFGPDVYRDKNLIRRNAFPEAFRDWWAARAAIRWEHDFGNGTTLALTPFVRRTAMRFLMHFLPGQPIEKNDHESVGLLSAYYFGLPGGFGFVAGADVEYTSGSLSEIQENPTVFSFVQGVHYDYDVDAFVVAPYVHSTWDVTDATRITAGLRLEYTRYDYTNNAPDGIVGRFLRTPDRTDDFFNPTPKLGVTHAFSDTLTGFANYARGARAPQTTDIYRLQSRQVPGDIESEKVDSIEAGARGVIHDVSYEVAAFYYTKSNFYFRDADGFNVSDGETEHIGVEAEFYAPLPWNFDLSGAATYARHTYAFDNVVSSTSNSTESIRDGDDVDTAPRTIANVRLGYSFLEGRGRAEIEWVHIGEYYLDPSNTVSYPGHDLLNFRADVAVTENLSVFGKVNNLTDTRFATRGDFAFGQERYFPGEPISVEVGAGVRF